MTLKVISRISAEKNTTTRDFSNIVRNSSNFLINRMMSTFMNTQRLFSISVGL